MIAAFTPGSDFKRYYRGRMPRLALAVILIMPLLYGALYLWAFWNPFGNVDKLPVAIVNLDKGYECRGSSSMPARMWCRGIIASKQLDLHEVEEADAIRGSSTALFVHRHHPRGFQRIDRLCGVGQSRVRPS